MHLCQSEVEIICIMYLHIDTQEQYVRAHTHTHTSVCQILTLNCHLLPLDMPISNSLCARLSRTAFNCGTVAGAALPIDFLLLKAQPKGS